MLSETVLALSQWQLTLTNLLHLLFVPLSLGLSLLVAILEIRFLFTGDRHYLEAGRFWAKLFSIAFALSMISRLAVLAQFGSTGSYFARYAGDSFALPLAIEAFSSFFLASVLFGPFWFGWVHLKPRQHAMLSSLLALSLHLSALWLICAYAWLDHPVGAFFNPESLRMELSDSWQVLNNPALSAYTLHFIGLAYAVAAGFIVSVCAWLQFNQVDNTIARSSLGLAASAGGVAILLLALHGNNQPASLAETVQQNTLRGIDNHPQLSAIENHIRNGLAAYRSLEAWREDEKNAPLPASFAQQKTDMGYALLLKRWLPKLQNANDQQIRLAAQSALPAQPQLLFWSHRLLTGAAMISLLLFVLAGYQALRRGAAQPVLAKLLLLALPLNGLLALGDIVISRLLHQPWLVNEILPAFLSYSSSSAKELIISLSLYTLTGAALISIAVSVIVNIVRSTVPAGASQ